MTKEEFKRRWEKDDDGDGLTFDDIADCAIEWGVNRRPRISPMANVRYQVLKAAGVSDAEEYAPPEDDD